jgi:hypothetical protein
MLSPFVIHDIFHRDDPTRFDNRAFIGQGRVTISYNSTQLPIVLKMLLILLVEIAGRIQRMGRGRTDFIRSWFDTMGLKY